MQKKQLLPALVLGITLGTGALILGAPKISAWMGAGPPGNDSGWGAELANHFGLNVDEVNSFIEEQRTQHQAEMQTQQQTEFENSLEAAVNAGTITSDQKQLLLDKHQELMAQIQAKRAQAQEDRQTRHDELEAWAQDNGIDPQVLWELLPGPRDGHGPRQDRPTSS